MDDLEQKIMTIVRSMTDEDKADFIIRYLSLFERSEAAPKEAAAGLDPSL